MNNYLQENKLDTGCFVVIDGTDGSGKGTQTKLLVERLRSQGFSVEVADFPQYGEKSAGLVEEYLNGKYGSAEEVGPYRASILYAVDRYAASFKIKKWIAEGKIVICNRYVTANMGHQGGKIRDVDRRKRYMEWLYNLEYKIFNIPKPDLNIILHVDAEIAQRLVDQKDTREYIHGKKRDIHEDDINHLRNAEKVYLEIAQSFPNFQLIECVEGGAIMSKESINDKIWRKVISKIDGDRRHITELSDDRNCKIHYLGSKGPEERVERNFTKERVLRVRRLSPIAKLPSRANESDAGLDLFAIDFHSLMPGERALVRTGIKMAIPEGFAGLIWDKSGVAKSGIHVMAGVIDSGYRGEVGISLINLSEDIYNISPGQKVAQIIMQKVELPEIIETEIDDKTERGSGGYGSSGMF